MSDRHSIGDQRFADTTLEVPHSPLAIGYCGLNYLDNCRTMFASGCHWELPPDIRCYLSRDEDE